MTRTSIPRSVSGDVDEARRLKEAYDALRAEIGKVIIGQDAIVEHLLIALLARGHCLLVGVPGLAKTLLIRTLAVCSICSSTGSSSRRI